MGTLLLFSLPLLYLSGRGCNLLPQLRGEAQCFDQEEFLILGSLDSPLQVFHLAFELVVSRDVPVSFFAKLVVLGAVELCLAQVLDNVELFCRLFAEGFALLLLYLHPLNEF